MYDNSGSMAFLAQLPLTITFEDYIGKEKLVFYKRDYQQMMYKLEIHQKRRLCLLRFLGKCSYFL
ncbi:cyclophilin-like fold protein [Priestia megaterium]